jgi:hypothetical protein
VLLIRGESGWTFKTSSTAGFGVEFVGVSGGSIDLKDPEGRTVAFRYGAVGAGLSHGLRLPKIGKVQLKVKGKAVGGTIAPASFQNGGVVYVLDTLARPELTRSDITGVCMFLEVFGGVIGGGSATAMLFGMNPAFLVGIAAMPLISVPFQMQLLSSATGILLMAGFNVGLVAGLGGGAFVGGLI